MKTEDYLNAPKFHSAHSEMWSDVSTTKWPKLDKRRLLSLSWSVTKIDLYRILPSSFNILASAKQNWTLIDSIKKSFQAVSKVDKSWYN